MRKQFSQVADQFYAMKHKINRMTKEIDTLKSSLTRPLNSPQERSVEDQDFPNIIKDIHQYSAYGNMNHRVSMGQTAPVIKK